MIVLKLLSGIEVSTLSIPFDKIQASKTNVSSFSISGTATYSFIGIATNSNLSDHEVILNNVQSSFPSIKISSESVIFIASNNILAFTVIHHSE